MGTVEPIVKSYDDKDTAGFVRGFVAKYEHSGIDAQQIFDYLKKLVKEPDFEEGD